MVGGALKKINGVKDPNRIDSQYQSNKKGSVLEYQPTPIHVLKAKSAGNELQYDPVSNFSSSSCRVTLPSCTKRSDSISAAIPAKRTKVIVDDVDDEIEAKFSDSDNEQTVGQTCSTVPATSDNTSAKSSENSLQQPLSTDQLSVKVLDSGNSSLLETSSTNQPLSVASTESAATVSQPKDSLNHFSMSASQTNLNDSFNCSSQTNLNDSSNCSESAKLQHTVLNKNNGTAQEHTSNSTASVTGAEKQHTDRDHTSSSGSGNKCHEKSTSHKNHDSNKTSKSKHHHSRSNDHHSCHSSSATSGKHSNKDNHKYKSTLSKSDGVNSSGDKCSVQEHRHSSDKHRKIHSHGKSGHSDKKAAAASSHGDGRTENVLTETSAHNPKSKLDGSISSVGKHTLSHRHSKEHKTSKTSLHKNCEHKQNAHIASSYHSSQECGSHTNSCQSKTVTTMSGEESKSSKHRHAEHKEHASITDSQHTRLTDSNRSHTKSCPSRTAASSASPLADTKRISALKNVELFGEDSDTESSFLQSPVSAQQSIDEVIILSTDDLSDASDNDDTFEQCQQLYNDLTRQQQSQPNTSTDNSIHKVGYLLSSLI